MASYLSSRLGQTASGGQGVNDAAIDATVAREAGAHPRGWVASTPIGALHVASIARCSSS
eukprot:scaffold427_cov263-Pinguiococcus_pyrenoidosus.AAC.18